MFKGQDFNEFLLSPFFYASFVLFEFYIETQNEKKNKEESFLLFDLCSNKSDHEAQVIAMTQKLQTFFLLLRVSGVSGAARKSKSSFSLSQ